MAGSMRLFPWQTKHLEARNRERLAPEIVPGVGVLPQMRRAESRCHNCYFPPGGIVEWPSEGGRDMIRLGPRQRVALERECAAMDPAHWPCIALLGPDGEPTEDIQCRGHWELRRKYGFLPRRTLRMKATRP